MFEKVKKILAEQLDVSEDRITMDANIVEDLEADSLSVMQVIMELEEEFNISVDDSDLNNLHTVGDIVRFVEAKTK
ncbi:MAG: acyl carrier protein [Candidatus Caccosoma sp.]|nr:acyl carrier protein [Candidatus Caccosoma sp.]